MAIRDGDEGHLSGRTPPWWSDGDPLAASRAPEPDDETIWGHDGASTGRTSAERLAAFSASLEAEYRDRQHASELHAENERLRRDMETAQIFIDYLNDEVGFLRGVVRALLRDIPVPVPESERISRD
jgi:hypothetical protein